MNILKTFSLCTFAFGTAIIAKYWGFHTWVEANTWIAPPMVVVGAIGICFLFGKGD